jgi:dolichol-phosphate mannosyltransferase
MDLSTIDIRCPEVLPTLSVTPEVTLSLTVIVPTRNEAGNIRALLERLQSALIGQAVEVIFVDDSSDNTPDVIGDCACDFSGMEIRLIHRAPEQRAGGLGSAVVTGLQAARAPFACVMDGDLQHPPELVPVLLKTAHDRSTDIVVASRRVEGSEVNGLNTARNLISKSLDLLARVLFSRELRGVSDPLTGFFLVRTAALALDTLHPKGFKILMEILVRHPDLRKTEIPFRFGERLAGKSKASATEVFRYLNLLWTLRFGEASLRFTIFALVGASGILVNSLAVALFTEGLGIHYLLSAALGTVVSSTWNFYLSEALVFGSRAQPGRLRRFGLFFLMNTAALALRTPMIYALTTGLGMHYLLSNLLSLVVLTVLRFFLADNLIWSSPRPKGVATGS